MNKTAQALGRLAKGHGKKLSPERREQLRARMVEMNRARWSIGIEAVKDGTLSSLSSSVNQ